VCVFFRHKGMLLKPWDVPGLTGPIMLSGVQCMGYESTIFECAHTECLTHNCNHSQDVFISCGDSPVTFGN